MAGFGTAIGVVLIAAIIVDLNFKATQRPTISERILKASLYRPIIAVLLTVILTAPVFMLLGHLFFPQHITLSTLK